MVEEVSRMLLLMPARSAQAHRTSINQLALINAIQTIQSRGDGVMTIESVIFLDPFSPLPDDEFEDLPDQSYSPLNGNAPLASRLDPRNYLVLSMA
jgi:hypothetical protein